MKAAGLALVASFGHTIRRPPRRVMSIITALPISPKQPEFRARRFPCASKFALSLEHALRMLGFSADTLCMYNQRTD